jgi:hypothetical protein
MGTAAMFSVLVSERAIGHGNTDIDFASRFRASAVENI